MWFLLFGSCGGRGDGVRRDARGPPSRGFLLCFCIPVGIRATEPCKHPETGGRHGIPRIDTDSSASSHPQRGGSELIASPSQHLTRHRCCQTVHSNTRGQTIAAVPSLGSDILRRAGFAIQVNQGWILADERYCVQGRTHNPAVQHHADAQTNFRCTTLRLAFGRAKIFSRPKQNERLGHQGLCKSVKYGRARYHGQYHDHRAVGHHGPDVLVLATGNNSKFVLPRVHVIRHTHQWMVPVRTEE